MLTQGQRTDIQAAKELIDSGCTLNELQDNYFMLWCKYEKPLTKYWVNRQAREPREPPVVYVHLGPPGTGKTRFVWDNHDHNDIWSWPGGQWFDGYELQSVALFDDFDEGPIPYRLLLKIIDRYRIMVPIKGGHVYFAPKIIYITTNVHPKEWYPKERDVAPLIRRIQQVKIFD